MQRQGVVHDVITCSALVSTFEKGNKQEQAVEVFQAMLRQGLMPDIIMYSALASACEKGM